jgi:zinc protease
MWPWCIMAALASPRLPVEQVQLDNGLRLLLSPDPSLPIVHMETWIHAGSRDEGARGGLAHLAEHLMFQGSASAPGDYFELIEAAGGYADATTTEDRTAYQTVVPAEELPRALFLESDRLGWLLLDAERLESQRAVVANERRQRFETQPYGLWWETAMGALWPADHPYAHPAIGSHAEIAAVTLEEARGFLDSRYGACNAVVALVGDFNREQAVGLARQHLGQLPACAAPSRLRPELPPLAQDIVLRREEAVPQSRLWLMWRAPAALAPGEAETSLLMTILGYGPTSRLSRALVARGLALEASASSTALSLAGVATLQLTPRPGLSTDELGRLALAELADIAGTRPVRPEELAQAQALYETSFYLALQRHSGKAHLLQGYLMNGGRPDLLEQDLARYRAARPDDLTRAAQALLAAHHVALHIHPLGRGPR